MTPLLIAVWIALAAASSPPGASPEETRLLDLVNRERASRRIALLRWDAALARLARAHAADMRAGGRPTHHSTADGADFARRLARTSYRARAAAENVAMDADVVRAHRGLMASPGHRANILNRELTAVGVGVVTGNDGAVYVVEDFAAAMEEMSDGEAARRVRRALARARARAGGRPLAEEAAVSRALARTLEELVAADSIKAGREAGFSSGWFLTYTTMDPAELPEGSESKVARARAYALAVVFHKTRSYPFGTYWVALALAGSP